VAVSALFYYYLEKVLGKSYDKFLNKILAWMHLLLMNIGATATMSMLIYAGYIRGTSMLSKIVEDWDLMQDKHINYCPFVDPIGVGIIVLSIGIILGGIGFMLTFIRKDTKEKHD
jgi:heme/copper-type cytochrome/quinol oxidase subunit 1